MRIALFALLPFGLSACGGGGGGDSGPPTPPPVPTVTLTAASSQVVDGATVSLTWSSTNATSCTASGGWSGTRPTGGSETVTPAGPATSYGLQCTGAGGSASASTTVTVATIPVVTLTATPGGPGSIEYSTPVRLTWSATSSNSCTTSGGWSGNRSVSGSEESAPLTATTSFTLACTGPAGTGSATITVNVASPAPPFVSLDALANPILVGQSSTLRWSTGNTGSCVASGGWSGTRAAGSGRTESTGPLNSTTTYTLTCTNPVASAQASETVSVVAAFPPVVSIQAQPGSLTAGSRSTLTWTATDATSCTASGGWSGSRPTSGTEVSGPINTRTTFDLSCTGPGGTGSGGVFVEVSGANNAPVADAGADQATLSGATVRLSGTRSSDAGGFIASYAWTQTGGPAVSLGGANTATASFVAPSVATDTTLTFRLVVADDAGAASAPDTVAVLVRPAPQGTVPLAGLVTFARIPSTQQGLAYTQMRQDPARGVTIIALNAGSLAEIARGQTGASGEFTLAVPPSTSLVIRVLAEMVRTGAAPTWRFEVKDASAAAATYAYGSAAANSGASGAVLDVAIPSGWDPATRVVNGTRDAAPFAVLDTVYQATQFLLGTAPTLNFAPLTIDWSPANTAVDGSHYSNGVNGPRITLTGEAQVDTDEYDPDIIAHEFGHYVEDIFSRSDSIGGPHSVGDRLDPRVAFGEGFGDAFAAMVTGDSIITDSFGQFQALAGVFDVEHDASVRGWYSESSVWAILWDLFDSSRDTFGDDMALGFAPLWQVLTGPQRSTEAVTSIFPFITALKSLQPTDAPAIDALVAGQQIQSATIDDFGSTESNSADSADVLPVFSPIAVDGSPALVRSIGGGAPAFGSPNKLSNHRFLRLDVAAPRTVRIVATAPSPRGADVIVYRRGVEIDRGEVAGDENFTVALPEAGAYVLDVYDCVNTGCTSAPSAPTRIDINVTITSN